MSAPEPYYADDVVTLHAGDCFDVLPSLPDCSVDAIVTDPPGAVGFMGKSWDSDRGGRVKWVAWLAERMEAAARRLKPGGHLLVWSLPRTSHWTALALEDAGLEIRDCILHLFGSGFPKSLDVSKAIDRHERGSLVRAKLLHFARERGINGRWLEEHGIASAASFTDWTTGGHVPADANWQIVKGALEVSDEEEAAFERAVVALARGKGTRSSIGPVGIGTEDFAVTSAATPEAARWAGFGTALKPGQEMWWLARKPFGGTVAANLLERGTGALNINGCRVGTAADLNPADYDDSRRTAPKFAATYENNGKADQRAGTGAVPDGRWPPNILLTHSASCEMTGMRKIKGITGGTGNHAGAIYGQRSNEGASVKDYADADGMETIEAWACAPDCPVAELDRQSGALASGAGPTRRGSDLSRDTYGEFAGQQACTPHRGADAGGASRFFPVFRYQAKAPASERPRLEDGTAHSTVKPLELMQWLVRLVTPPGGIVLDPFGGSGTTAEACIIEGFRCILIEQDPAYAELIKARLSKPIQPVLFGGAA